MAATNGRYYLICNYDKYDNLSHYRIDRITNIRILDEKRKPMNRLADGQWSLPKHMAEHLYMFAGKSIRAKFKADNGIIDQIIDWFGMDVAFQPMDENSCVATVHVNEDAFFYWAMQYGLYIEVLEPTDMRERVKQALKTISVKYSI